MRLSPNRTKCVVAAGLMLACAVAFADGTSFSDFAPLATSAGPTADESAPITFGNDFRQRSIADRDTQLFALTPNTGSWDMMTLNETGPDKGRYLFTVFETDQAGVQRHDLLTGETDTIWYSPVFEGHVSFDPSLLDTLGNADCGRGKLVHECRRPHEHLRSPVRTQESTRRSGHL